MVLSLLHHLVRRLVVVELPWIHRMDAAAKDPVIRVLRHQWPSSAVRFVPGRDLATAPPYDSFVPGHAARSIRWPRWAPWALGPFTFGIGLAQKLDRLTASPAVGASRYYSVLNRSECSA